MVKQDPSAVSQLKYDFFLDNFFKRSSRVLIVGDARYLPFKSSVFHEILLADVIEHFPDQAFLNTVLAEISRIIKKEGEVAVISPLKDNILIVRKLYNWIMKLPVPIMALPEHTLAFSKSELLRSFKGFDVIADSTWDGNLFGIKFPLIGGEYAFLIFKKNRTTNPGAD